MRPPRIVNVVFAVLISSSAKLALGIPILSSDPGKSLTSSPSTSTSTSSSSPLHPPPYTISPPPSTSINTTTTPLWTGFTLPLTNPQPLHPDLTLSYTLEGTLLPSYLTALTLYCIETAYHRTRAKPRDGEFRGSWAERGGMQVHLMPFVVVVGDDGAGVREGEGKVGEVGEGENTGEDKDGVLVGEAVLQENDSKQGEEGSRGGRITNEEAAAAWLILSDTVVKMRGMRSGMEFDVLRRGRAVAGGKVLKV